ncbi:SpoIIE family protein phosphatase [Streptomyces griseiscabiei]|uniref:SpoIIE family protein phosphatase n=1 Tax=Streptomyces griseiscabiei TaxID=2993540 RepID=A0ABU4L480_9ACTN|nr:SpoIIE family protein phosphatase [Streptomyces griseiscabiei]MBZ3905436.1 SpoIIE family protein phosphatase [Streptomyces griseiscabiei]MDX2910526.1 SpoIIE family protein phosphatase [Streptomyces griseiscabiei]
MATDEAPEASAYGVDEALSANVTIDGHGVVTRWNAGAEELLGYSPARIVGQPAADLLAEEIDEQELRSFTLMPRWNGLIALRHRDGHRLEIKVLAHKRALADGRREWFLVSALPGLRPQPDDNTLMSWDHEQVAGCHMAVYDTGLRMRLANEATHRAVALTDDDVRGLRASEIVDHPSMETMERSMLRALQTGEPQTLEIYGGTPSEGREHAWSLVLTPLKDEGSRVQGVGVAMHDMTEQYWARKRLMLLAEASRCIGSTLDVTRTAQELADVAVPEFADFASVDLLPSLDVNESAPGSVAPYGPVPLRRVAHQSVNPGIPEAVVAPGQVSNYPESSPPVESLRSGHTLLYHATDSAIAEWMAVDQSRAARIRDFGIHSAITVPLTARGTTLGVVVFVRHQHPEVFHEDDLLLAEELAARAAVCIDNARRYTRQRATAVTLQRSLLPQALPTQAAVEVASRYLPAGARAGVGGDWFDIIPLSGARVALVVGDVVGHGIHASATMGRLRTAVLTLADIDLPPDELLTHLDDVVARLSTEEKGAPQPDPGAETTGDVGATCLYAVYDPVSRHCTIALAGHPAPALVTPDGTAKLLDLPVGPPLGLGGLPFEATDIELPEGSLLALYTDGLIEARERDIDVSQSLLCQSLAQPSTSLDNLCDAVLAALLSGRPSDDIALLIARTKALDSDWVATWEIPADPAAVAQARKKAIAQLEAWGLDDACFVTELVVSELVTNAIRYGQPPIHLRLIRDRNLICEVSDSSGTAPHLRRARTFDEGGRGLLLVAQLTATWGTRQTPQGKTIWSEQTLPVSP